MLGCFGEQSVDIDIPPEWRERVKKIFPMLKEDVSFEYTSPIDYNYNCLSWALSCNTMPFDKAKGAFWPWAASPDTAEGWAEVCKIHGFQPAENGDFEVGYEKIAIFRDDETDDPDEPNLHAARQDRTGRWKSKLGDLGPDIDHDKLTDLESGYGKVALYLKRHRPDWV